MCFVWLWKRFLSHSGRVPGEPLVALKFFHLFHLIKTLGAESIPVYLFILFGVFKLIISIFLSIKNFDEFPCRGNLSIKHRAHNIKPHLNPPFPATKFGCLSYVNKTSISNGHIFPLESNWYNSKDCQTNVMNEMQSRITLKENFFP